MIIYGSKMYGVKNTVHSFGLCGHCGKYAKQKSYDGRKWGHLYFIPLIPEGGHVRVLKECSGCQNGQHVPRELAQKVYNDIEQTLPSLLEATAQGQRSFIDPRDNAETNTAAFCAGVIDILITTGHGQDVQGILDLLTESGTHYEPCIGRAIQAELQGQLDQAAAEMEKAQAAAPDQPYTYIKLAEYHGLKGQHEAQLEQLQQACALTEDDVAIMLDMAAPLEALERYPQLVELLDACIAKAPQLAQDKNFMKLYKKYAKKAKKA